MAAVLVVDDDIQIQRLLGARLRQWGLVVEFATDGPHAVAAALSRKFALILLDIHLPIFDGYRVLTLIREGGCTTPVVAFSAAFSPEDEKELRAKGFSGILMKPFTPAALKAVCLAAEPSLVLTSSSDSLGADELADLRKAFLQVLPMRVHTLREAAARKEWSLVARIAHDFAIAPTYGLENLGKVAAGVELAANKQDEGKITSQLEKLYKEVEALCAAEPA